MANISIGAWKHSGCLSAAALTEGCSWYSCSSDDTGSELDDVDQEAAGGDAKLSWSNEVMSCIQLCTLSGSAQTKTTLASPMCAEVEVAAWGTTSGVKTMSVAAGLDRAVVMATVVAVAVIVAVAVVVAVTVAAATAVARSVKLLTRLAEELALEVESAGLCSLSTAIHLDT